MLKSTVHRILVTSARFSSALSIIRKFARCKNTVFASDTFRSSSGLHSRYIERPPFLTTVSPRYEPDCFVSAIADIVEKNGIEVIIPIFEEAFYLAHHVESEHKKQHNQRKTTRIDGSLLGGAELFAPSFDSAISLHDKVKFLNVANDCNLTIPSGVVVCETSDELRRVMREMKRHGYVARPAYGSASQGIIINSGQGRDTDHDAGDKIQLESCYAPTKSNPYLVQEYIEGTDLCSCSIVQHGTVMAHVSYIHRKETSSVGSVVIETIEEPETLRVAQRLAEYTNYHGFLSLDFRRRTKTKSSPSSLGANQQKDNNAEMMSNMYAIECNPRPTMGIVGMPDVTLVNSILYPPQKTRDMLYDASVTPGGRRYKMSSGLILDMLSHPFHAASWSWDWRELMSSDSYEIYAEKGDVMPAFYQYLSAVECMLLFRRRMGRWTSLGEAYVHDVSWDRN